MKFRIPDLILVVLLIVGLGFFGKSALDRSRLEVDYRRLVQATGDFSILDPTKPQFLALETGEPLHFAWRVYLPPKTVLSLKSPSGGISTFRSSPSGEFIARVRIREGEDGLLSTYLLSAGSSSRGSFGDMALAHLIRGRREQILVEQLGLKEIRVVDPGKPTLFLRLTLSPELEAEARKTLSPEVQKTFVPVLFEVGF